MDDFQTAAQKTYSEALHTFLRFFPDKELSEIQNDDIVRFNNNYIIAKKSWTSFHNQVVNVLKLAIKVRDDRRLDLDLIHRPKREKVFPIVLSKEEVKAILHAPTNVKHHAMLCLIYACGLRCIELIQLCPENIHSNRGMKLIRQDMGKKYLMVRISEKTILMLREYDQMFKLKRYLFEGAKDGEPYTSRSLQLELMQAVAMAGINKPITLN